MQRVLTPERRVPLPLSLRFFASGPVFAMGVGVLIAASGADLFASRWSPAALACTHLAVLGMLTMVMTGALLQIVPVVFGVELPLTLGAARAIHLMLGAGALLLAAALAGAPPLLYVLASALLLGALGWLAIMLGAALRRAHTIAALDVLRALRLAVAALLPTALLGATMATALAGAVPLPLPLEQLTSLHLLWGLFGWVATLVAGVSFQVIPMFQVTPPYPRALTRLLLPAAALCMAAASLALFHASAWFYGLAALVGVAFACFALVSLALLAQRKRPSAEASTWLMRLAMASLLACLLLWVIPGEAPWRALALGVLFIVGFAWSAVTGMLYKIIPFLLWQHWQEQGFAKPVPGIRFVIPERRAMVQLGLHAVSLGLLVAACVWPALLARSAGLAFVAANAALGLNLWRALRLQPAY